MDTERLLRINEVCTATGFSRSHFYQLIKKNLAPNPVGLGRARRWRQSEIQKFIRSLPVVDLSNGGGHEK